MDNTISIDPRTDALVVIDIQNDFCPGGALAVAGGDEIVAGVAALAARFDTIVLSQDWHPSGHSSFASTHGKDPFTSIDLAYGPQTLWPDHCVQGSRGAAFTVALEVSGVTARACALIRKGANPAIDSYSAFFENDKATSTGLAGLLRDRGIRRVWFVGLAYDFCVGYSALDARSQGFEAIVVKDLTRAIAMPLGAGTTVDAIEERFAEAGVVVADTPVAYAPSRPRHATH